MQSLTKKNFGFVTTTTANKELIALKNKWLDFLSNKVATEFKPAEFKNAKIVEITNLDAIEALIISLKESTAKVELTKKCLKNIYNLDEMPEDKTSSANYCNPDTYTLSYLGILFGDEKTDVNKDAKWWKSFWDKNRNNLLWNAEKGFYEVKK